MVKFVHNVSGDTSKVHFALAALAATSLHVDKKFMLIGSTNFPVCFSSFTGHHDNRHTLSGSLSCCPFGSHILRPRGRFWTAPCVVPTDTYVSCVKAHHLRASCRAIGRWGRKQSKRKAARQHIEVWRYSRWIAPRPQTAAKPNSHKMLEKVCHSGPSTFSTEGHRGG